ncbi:esterase/lipase family protein [Lysobacter soli]|uniref:esterase/lipase family protein n=1 Tax=Lysobacter soli TaxID=453783 RepID=UPI00240EAE12|nr:hypothetical protein [Lysobacter soli]MDG2517809.1 hypothetical protein [Lysobacter soli]
MAQEGGAVLAELELIGASDAPIGHVIFLHGLTGEKRATWTAAGVEEGFWPVWLLDDVPRLAAWTVGYEAPKTNWFGRGMDLANRAQNILTLLLHEKRLADGKILFITHSLGGLVAKQIIRTAEGSTGRGASAFAERVRGIAFLGTPHRGADLALYSRILGAIARRSDSLQVLERNNPQLRDLNEWYRSYSRRRALSNLVLMETQPRSIFGISLPQMFGQVVQFDSADPGLECTATPVDADHTTISKPLHRGSEVYVCVLEFARDALSTEAGVSTTTNDSATTLRKLAELPPGADHIIEAVVNQALAIAAEPPSLDGDVVDHETRRRLLRIRRSRYFPGVDAASEARTLFAALKSGDLKRTSAAVRHEALTWCARLLSFQDLKAAQVALEEAKAYGQSSAWTVARALIQGRLTGIEDALAMLAPIRDPAARTAGLIAKVNSGTPEAALHWFQACGLSAADLDADGKFVLLQMLLQTGQWIAATELASRVASDDIEETPGLARLCAFAFIAESLPKDVKHLALAGVPLDAANVPLSGEASATEYRRSAEAMLCAASKFADSLGLDEVSADASDTALWLRLRDPQLHAAALVELEQSMRDASLALRRLPLALSFRVSVDKDAIEREIERKQTLSGGKTRVASDARFALAIAQRGPRDAALYIDRHRDEILHSQDAGELLGLELRLLIEAGEIAVAQQRLSERGSLDLDAESFGRLQNMIASAESAHGEAPTIMSLEEATSLPALMNLIEALERQEDKGRLLPATEKLFEMTKDVKAAERHAIALYDSSDVVSCLTFLQSIPEIVSQSQKLQSLMAWSLYGSGEFAAARSLLPAMTLQDPYNARTLATNLAISSGDWESIQRSVEDDWANREDRRPIDLVAAAKLAVQIGSSRSKDLLREAVRKGVDDPAVLLGAYVCATEGGFEDSGEAFEWLSRAAELSGPNGPVQKMTLEQVKERQPDFVRRERDVSEAYAHAEMPAFLVAKSLNRSQSSLVTLAALTNRDELDARRRSWIPAFSGARAPDDMIAVRSVAIDVSALLNLELLGLTDQAFDQFEKVVIPHGTMAWLFRERQHAVFHQPSQVERAIALQRLISDGSLETFTQENAIPSELVIEVGSDLAALLSDAAVERPNDARQRIVVQSGRVHKVGSLLEEPADVSAYHQHLCGLPTLIEKLREKGELTASEKRTCDVYFSGRGTSEGATSIQDGAIVYLDYPAVAALQHLNLIHRVRKAGLTPVLSTGAQEWANEITRHAAYLDDLGHIIESLRERLKTRIDAGSIKVAPMPSETDEERDTNPTMQLMRITDAVDGLIVDDRFVNKHQQSQLGSRAVPVLTTLDVIAGLRRTGRIDLERQVECLGQLRRCGFLLVPTSTEELSFLLRSAQHDDAGVVESAELRAVRESILGSQMVDIVRLPSDGPWLAAEVGLLPVAVEEQWRTGQDVGLVAAKANWLVETYDAIGWAQSVFGASGSEGLQRTRSAQLLQLIVLGAKLNKPMRAAYEAWLDERLLKPLSQTEPTLFSAIVNNVAQLISTTILDRGNGHD